MRKLRDGKQARPALDLSVMWPGPRVPKAYYLQGTRAEAEKLVRPYGEVTGFHPYYQWEDADGTDHDPALKYRGRTRPMRPNCKKVWCGRTLVMATAEAHLALYLYLRRDERTDGDEHDQPVTRFPPVVKRLGPKERRIARRKAA
jgi:hypothetical protein